MSVRIHDRARHAEMVEDTLLDLRGDGAVVAWIGIDGHDVADYLERWLAATGNAPRSAAIAEALWRHFEELNP